MPNTAVRAAGGAAPSYPNSSLHPTSGHDTSRLLEALEGALSMASSLADAVEKLSERTAEPARRLSAVCAVCEPLITEIETARQATRDLYNVYFAGKPAAEDC